MLDTEKLRACGAGQTRESVPTYWRIMTATCLAAPQGLEQIASTFEDVQKYHSPRWQVASSLASIALPLLLNLSFDQSQTISHFTCHKLPVTILVDVFGKIASRGLQDRVTTLGGMLCLSAATY